MKAQEEKGIEEEPHVKYARSQNKDKEIWKSTVCNALFHNQCNKIFELGSQKALDYDDLFKIQDEFKYPNTYGIRFKKLIDSNPKPGDPDYEKKFSFMGLLFKH